MLNIPDSVKALFKQDGVYKNFRAHFPNGELADITNENIVQESVKFTESVCSQDVFKFGLTEASVIEFETVGVANMYGMAIECSCEIDCSSLSAADKADITAGTWDGTWDGVNEVFSVPYGTFRVESCPRDHQSMAHRKVTAYTEGLDIESLFETQKTLTVFTNIAQNTTITDAVYWTTVFASQPDEVLNYGYSKRQLNLYVEERLRLSYVPITLNGSTKSLELRPDCGSLKDPDYNGRWVDFNRDYGGAVGRFYKDCLLCVKNSGSTFPRLDDADVKAQMVEDLQSATVLQNYDPTTDGYADYNEIVETLLSLANKNQLSTSMEYSIPMTSTLSRAEYIPVPANTLIYPFYSTKKIKTNDGAIGLEALCGYHFKISGTNFGQRTFEQPEVFLYTNQNPSGYTMTHESTLSTQYSSQSVKAEMYSFYNAYSMRDFIQGQLETRALFLAVDRNGGNRLMRIDNTSPSAIIPGEYSQMWFDEFAVEEIGTVRYSYIDDAGEEQTVDYQFGDGESVYDMTGNEALRMLDGADPSVIEAMLDAYFIPNISAVNFVPVDLTMKGLPYIEAGDALSVTAHDGTVCASYALRHEINGIQSLEAQIDSQSGLIIDSEEAAT